ncbi:MAG TPA: relaxase/mobilization nuclease domain-containing protein [Chitinophagales bacterium]|nr:relaxase/mobilization nuclease domain-containing protein [Chitinophagales bacterium]HRG26888.1 relaxase/mobilization nuclease domain-containing protein [Chitinophagales bacterium]HRG85222.1 relaxase/mobilization nuclease domain-containing protein [Chitinophagales bacterium]
MIVKSLTRRSNTLQLVNYLFKQEKGERLQPILKRNLRSRTAEGWAKEIDANDALRIRRRTDNIRLYHTVLSFSDRDKAHIDKSLLKDISKKYVELRGRDSIFLASSHTDKDHIHLHIIQSGTKYLTGESNRISKKEFHELKLALDLYQKEKYPQLIHSLPEHGKSLRMQKTEREYQSQNRGGILSQKEQLFQTMETAYTKSKSLGHFLDQLKSEGYNSYNRGGKLYGLEDTEGRHYRFKTLDYAEKIKSLQKEADIEEKALQDLADLRESKNMEREEEYEREMEEEETVEEETETDDSDPNYTSE